VERFLQRSGCNFTYVSERHNHSTGPLDPIRIEANTLSHPNDMKPAIASIEICREIGYSEALRPFVKRELMPGN
jgi:hypothetical protein